MEKLIILDYDNTIAKPESPPSKSMLNVLEQLLKKNKVAILTAGRSIKGLKDFLILNTSLNNPTLLKNLLLCSKYGNLILEYEEGWFVLHESTDIPNKERAKLEQTISELNWEKYINNNNPTERIEDKGPVISVNCLGNSSSDQEKESWDKDGSKRKDIMRDILQKLGDKYEIYITGRNTIDIVPKGKNKADNVILLCKLTAITLDNAIYIGDEFNPNGNDYPITFLGIKIHHVKNPAETEKILERYI